MSKVPTAVRRATQPCEMSAARRVVQQLRPHETELVVRQSQSIRSRVYEKASSPETAREARLASVATTSILELHSLYDGEGG
jgi:hypothetical protein